MRREHSVPATTGRETVFDQREKAASRARRARHGDRLGHQLHPPEGLAGPVRRPPLHLAPLPGDAGARLDRGPVDPDAWEARGPRGRSDEGEARLAPAAAAPGRRTGGRRRAGGLQRLHRALTGRPELHDGLFQRAHDRRGTAGDRPAALGRRRRATRLAPGSRAGRRRSRGRRLHVRQARARPRGRRVGRPAEPGGRGAVRDLHGPGQAAGRPPPGNLGHGLDAHGRGAAGAAAGAALARAPGLDASARLRLAAPRLGDRGAGLSRLDGLELGERSGGRRRHQRLPLPGPIGERGQLLPPARRGLQPAQAGGRRARADGARAGEPELSCPPRPGSGARQGVRSAETARRAPRR